MTSDDLEHTRREAVHALCVAQAREQLSVELFEQRLALVREAPTTAAVWQILGDIGDPGGDDRLQRLDTPLPVDPPAAVAPLERLRVSAIFSGAKRSGRWTVPLVIEARIRFGNVKLDLRDAWFDSDTVEIEVDAICGALDLVSCHPARRSRMKSARRCPGPTTSAAARQLLSGMGSWSACREACS